ncbi:hypothetical protein HHK36_027653 [Tetracentron sinense]|uniref:Uncharacterized protein n=1 Tax=Tetracentron sinense TaxID=13715 RepID=A0A835D1R5_TETSI|nr:hypothetical protein HHK36_027653 [Tetracentron sinense]
MVSVNPNPAEGFYLDPMGMALPGLGSLAAATTTATTTTTTSSSEDLSKKIRKPYIITKSRESWTEQEHDKFLEALQLYAFKAVFFSPFFIWGFAISFDDDTYSWFCLCSFDSFSFDRDWKKIEAFVGSKTVIQVGMPSNGWRSGLWRFSNVIMEVRDLVIQENISFSWVSRFVNESANLLAKDRVVRRELFSEIRSHAQKYFLKVQKNGTSEHVPPPRPKRKAAHPYPQKASKNDMAAPVFSQVAGSFQSSPPLPEPGYVLRPDSSSILGNPIPSAAMSPWAHNSAPPVCVSHVVKDDIGSAGPTVVNNCCCSSTESTPRTWPTGETNDQGNDSPQLRGEYLLYCKILLF